MKLTVSLVWRLTAEVEQTRQRARAGLYRPNGDVFYSELGYESPFGMFLNSFHNDNDKVQYSVQLMAHLARAFDRPRPINSFLRYNQSYAYEPLIILTQP